MPLVKVKIVVEYYILPGISLKTENPLTRVTHILPVTD